MTAGTIDHDLIRARERAEIEGLADADLRALLHDTERWLALAEADGKPAWLVAWMGERRTECRRQIAWRKRAATHGAPPLDTHAWRERIREAKLALDIREVVERSGVCLKRAGSVWRGLCPFHAEHTPSFVVWPSTQRWRCFGCEKHGDALDYIRTHDGLTLADAITATLGQSFERGEMPALEAFASYGSVA